MMGGGIERSGCGDRGRKSVVRSGVNAVEWDVGNVKYVLMGVRGM